jgi:hypothetical protein
MRVPAWTPLLLVALALVAWPVAGSFGSGPRAHWVHAEEGDPIVPGDPINADAGDTASDLAAAGVTSVGLEPAPWTGTERSTDYTPSTSSGSKIKLVYAYASDAPDRFGQYADIIQTDAKAVAETVAAASNGAKTLRFDTGTDGGAGYVDIASIQLPQSGAAYRAMNAASRSNAIRDYVKTVLPMSGTVHYAVYADGLYGGDNIAGIAEMYNDTRKAAYNYNNVYPLWAMVWGDGGASFSSSHRTTLLHEISHTLGAVQTNAPHATNYGHCSEQADVMCYNDGGLKAGQSMVTNCPTTQYDCNADDYFNPAPAAGSYLATYWNVYDSAFLCAPASCVNGGPTDVAPEGPEANGTPTSASPGTGTTTTATPPASSGTPTTSGTGTSRARSRIDRAVAATLAAARARLRNGIPARLRLSFSAPASGRLTVALKVGARQVAHVARRVRTGRRTVTLRVPSSARRSAARAASASVEVRFIPVTGSAASARATIAVAR